MIQGGEARAMRLVMDVLRAGAASGTSPLGDGTTGWHMRRTDDCQSAALATLLQVPLSEVPDAHIDERLARGETVEHVDRTSWDQMLRWLEGRGLKLIRHGRPPTHLPRWLGIVPNPAPFQGHTLVMARSRVLFDPAVKPGIGNVLRRRGPVRVLNRKGCVNTWLLKVEASITGARTSRRPSSRASVTPPRSVSAS